MKFILNEELTLDEKKLYPSELKSIAQVMKNKGYNNNQITSTIKDIEDDESGYTAQHWLDQIENSNDNTEQQSQTNEPEDQEQDDINTLDTDETVEHTVNALKKINSNATDRFLNAIKGQIKNTNYPFTRLLAKKPAFMDALGITISLNEDGPFSSLVKGAFNLKDKANKNAQNKDAVIKFIKIYNAFTKNDNDIMNEYIDDDNALIYKKDLLSNIKNDWPINKIINIDAAATINKNNKLRGALVDAIRKNDLDTINRMNSYKLGSKKSENDLDDDNLSDDVKTAVRAFKKLNKDQKINVIKAGLSAMKGV